MNTSPGKNSALAPLSPLPSSIPQQHQIQQPHQPQAALVQHSTLLSTPISQQPRNKPSSNSVNTLPLSPALAPHSTSQASAPIGASSLTKLTSQSANQKSPHLSTLNSPPLPPQTSSLYALPTSLTLFSQKSAILANVNGISNLTTPTTRPTASQIQPMQLFPPLTPGGATTGQQLQNQQQTSKTNLNASPVATSSSVSSAMSPRLTTSNVFATTNATGVTSTTGILSSSQQLSTPLFTLTKSPNVAFPVKPNQIANINAFSLQPSQRQHAPFPGSFPPLSTTAGPGSAKSHPQLPSTVHTPLTTTNDSNPVNKPIPLPPNSLTSSIQSAIRQLPGPGERIELSAARGSATPNLIFRPSTGQSSQALLSPSHIASLSPNINTSVVSLGNHNNNINAANPSPLSNTAFLSSPLLLHNAFQNHPNTSLLPNTNANTKQSQQLLTPLSQPISRPTNLFSTPLSLFKRAAKANEASSPQNAEVQSLGLDQELETKPSSALTAPTKRPNNRTDNDTTTVQNVKRQRTRKPAAPKTAIVSDDDAHYDHDDDEFVAYNSSKPRQPRQAHRRAIIDSELSQAETMPLTHNTSQNTRRSRRAHVQDGQCGYDAEFMDENTANVVFDKNSLYNAAPRTTSGDEIIGIGDLINLSLPQAHQPYFNTISDDEGDPANSIPSTAGKVTQFKKASTKKQDQSLSGTLLYKAAKQANFLRKMFTAIQSEPENSIVHDCYYVIPTKYRYLYSTTHNLICLVCFRTLNTGLIRQHHNSHILWWDHLDALDAQRSQPEQQSTQPTSASSSRSSSSSSSSSSSTHLANGVLPKGVANPLSLLHDHCEICQRMDMKKVSHSYHFLLHLTLLMLGILKLPDDLVSPLNHSAMIDAEHDTRDDAEQLNNITSLAEDPYDIRSFHTFRPSHALNSLTQYTVVDQSEDSEANTEIQTPTSSTSLPDPNNPDIPVPVPNFTYQHIGYYGNNLRKIKLLSFPHIPHKRNEIRTQTGRSINMALFKYDVDEFLAQVSEMSKTLQPGTILTNTSSLTPITIHSSTPHSAKYALQSPHQDGKSSNSASGPSQHFHIHSPSLFPSANSSATTDSQGSQIPSTNSSTTEASRFDPNSTSSVTLYVNNHKVYPHIVPITSLTDHTIVKKAYRVIKAPKHCYLCLLCLQTCSGYDSDHCVKHDEYLAIINAERGTKETSPNSDSTKIDSNTPPTTQSTIFNGYAFTTLPPQRSAPTSNNQSLVELSPSNLAQSQASPLPTTSQLPPVSLHTNTTQPPRNALNTNHSNFRCEDCRVVFDNLISYRAHKMVEVKLKKRVVKVSPDEVEELKKSALEAFARSDVSFFQVHFPSLNDKAVKGKAVQNQIKPHHEHFQGFPTDSTPLTPLVANRSRDVSTCSEQQTPTMTLQYSDFQPLPTPVSDTH